jgi:hypothetical protein
MGPCDIIILDVWSKVQEQSRSRRLWGMELYLKLQIYIFTEAVGSESFGNCMN